jgi:DNA helicase HerA-like ATPase
MNAIEDETVELVSAVVARMLFRLLRRADPRNRFPVHLVLEEAHRYVASTPSRYAMDAAKVFERIAKEGRKYGMFLMLASQRPSELSKTVLSQCSNFVVHRIQNPDDLSQIRLMTPFISDTVLRRLPSLPKQHALVFGTSVNLPTTFKVREAAPRPHSDDTKIVDLWFHEEGRPANIRLGTASPTISPSAPDASFDKGVDFDRYEPAGEEEGDDQETAPSRQA